MLRTSRQLALSILMPLLTGALMVVLTTSEATRQWLDPFKGIPAPFVTVIGMPLGLFTALMASELWSKLSLARAAVQDERFAHAMLMEFALARREHAALASLLTSYAQELSSNEWPLMRAGKRVPQESRLVHLLLQAILGLDSSLPSQQAQIGLFERLVEARNSRIRLAVSNLSEVKWITVWLLGLLTQAALSLITLGNDGAALASVGLLSVSVSFCLAILVLFDEPFAFFISEVHLTAAADTARPA